jgi:hypothetical protein
MACAFDGYYGKKGAARQAMTARSNFSFLSFLSREFLARLIQPVSLKIKTWPVTTKAEKMYIRALQCYEIHDGMIDAFSRAIGHLGKEKQAIS